MKILFTTLLLITSGFLFSQEYVLKRELTNNDKPAIMALVKELFYVQTDANYLVRNNDAMTSFADMPDEIPNDDARLKQLEAELSKDPQNPLVLNKLANFYYVTNQTVAARYYFQQSYDRMDQKYFTGDESSLFYSMRGILKHQLEMAGAIKDIEDAIAMNPKDSIAMLFYPIFLMNEGRISEMKAVSAKMLDTDKPSLVAYVMLMLSEFNEGAQKFMEELAKNENNTAPFREKGYTEFSKTDLLDHYAVKFKGNQEIANVREMADIYKLYFKIALFDISETNQITLAYTPNDLKRLKELEQWLIGSAKAKTLNPYAQNKNLGYVYFMMGDKDKAVKYFNKAIEVFPAKKSSAYFNVSDAYDGLSATYYLNADTSNFRKTVERKIASDPDNKSLVDCRALAQTYYLNGNISRALEWVNRAHEINPEDFQTLRLLAHLILVQGGPGSDRRAQDYLLKCSKYIADNGQNYELCLQYGIYMLFDSGSDIAIKNILAAKETKKAAKEECELCDRVLKEYFVSR